jgi:hypothetical protein
MRHSRTQSAAKVLLIVALSAHAWSCAAAEPRRNRFACDSEEGREVELTMSGPSQQLRPPCSRFSEIYIAGPIQLTALAEGLRVQLRVHDDSYAPGPYREPRCERYQQTDSGAPQHCQRDAVVLFPTAMLPGASSVELATSGRPDGYQVDHIIPWNFWNVERGLGRFRLQMIIFDRGPSGTETELRVNSMLALADPTSLPAEDDGGARP